MRRVLCLALLFGCEGSTGALDPTADGGFAGDMRAPVGSVCDLETLAAACPPGSLPIVDEQRGEACGAMGEITTDDGAVTGVCRTREACTFICNFSDPCPCGIDRITAEGVFCAECVTACGDAKCEGAEDPASCPIDCAERCTADVERCNGPHREVCEDTGLWTTITCRDDQRCTFAGDPVAQGITLCETRDVDGGGVFPGLGSWHPVEIDDYSGVRFPALDLDALPLGFDGDGQLLAMNARGPRLVRIDLSDPAEPIYTTLPDALPSPLEDDYGLHRGRGVAVARTRYAGADQVWDLDAAGGTRLLADFGGTPTTIADLLQLQRGPWAISPDGSTVAHAIAVPFAGQLFATIIIWDAATGQVRTLLRYSEPQFGVEPGDLPVLLALSADGAGLLTGYVQADGLLLVRWDVAARQHARPIIMPVQSPVAFALSRAGDDRLALTDGRRGEVWDLAAEARLSRFEQPGEHLAFTPDGAQVVVGDAWLDATTGQRLGAAPGEGTVLFDPRQPRLIVGKRLYQ